ncbi:ead/Ea22-like family protein [Enterobacter hormaechei subsp. xiangfangensis]|uniref:ead/Ea22-like family protein n=1 Tax=Enterobacter hormaechei TaxID=158836 RepID=UPI003204E9BE
MSNIDKQALRSTSERDWFEDWFKREFHPDKTGPYIKDQLFFAVRAARAPLLDELEAAEKRIAELEAREVVLPSTQDVHPLGPQSAKIFCEFHRSIVNRCADEIRKVGVKVSIKGN